ncbi:16254_t:CDS:2 [Funneliformis geosporum]|uniref:6174_t:CDS:1 n=1 Tax=Funneliformis geosporum TaxID=1117311 RepID=A0A9W4WNA7_9GLOM|nr:16254_t:CDS:2 [Funneliformis geosporum]CAI2174612.1 6174_t:CDS:2 [Funneliformis geosporum]
MPKIEGKDGKVLGTLNKHRYHQYPVNQLRIIDDLCIKDDVEEKITEHDSETAAEINKEKKITRKIYRIDLIITYLLFYTALLMQWLTLLAISGDLINLRKRQEPGTEVTLSTEHTCGEEIINGKKPKMICLLAKDDVDKIPGKGNENFEVFLN